MKSLSISVFVLILSYASLPAQSTAPPSLADVQNQYREKHGEIQAATRNELDALKRSYLATLLRRESAARKARDLDRVVEIRSEIERVEKQARPAVIASPPPGSLENLRATWNRSIQALEVGEDREERALGVPVLQYITSRQGDLVEKGKVDEAIQWREWGRELAASLPPEPEENKEPPPNPSPTPGSGIPYRLVLWNTHHGNLASRGTKEVYVEAFYQGRRVLREKNIEVAWSPDKALSTEIPLQVPAMDEIKITIVEWHKNGGGLSEIELFRGPKTKIKFASVKASSATEKKYAADKLTDGIRNSDKMGRGYWLPEFRSEASILLKLD